MTDRIRPDIRPVEQADAFSIGQIYCGAWKEAYRDLLPHSYLDSLTPDRWASLYTDPCRTALALWDSGRPVGIVSYHQGRQKGLESWGEISSIYLLPCCWGRGYGSLLLREALERLAQMGFDKVYLWVLQGNSRAIRFYERQGFVFSGDTLETAIGGQKVTELRYIQQL